MKSILVVDDQPELRQLVCLSLGDRRFSIRQAANGQQALDEARREVPDLVILDLQMPGTPDGFGVCWEIKTDPRFERTKVLILSGQSVRGSHRACEAFGADGFVPKPFSPTELASRVDNLLAGGPESAGPDRRRVLIVDDRPELRKLVGLTLGTEDYDLAEAEDGRQALAAARRLRPDVVVLDVMMPGDLTGYEVCAAIKGDPDLAGIQVLMLTARSQAEDRAAAARFGADDFVAKPFSPLDLIERVGRLMAAPAASARG